MQHLSRVIPQVTRSKSKSIGFVSQLIANWDEIAGKDYADKTMPFDIKSGKIYVLCPSALRTAFQFQEQIIVQRVSTRWPKFKCDGIRLEDWTTPIEGRPRKKANTRDFSEEVSSTLQELETSGCDPEIIEKLKSLGNSLYKDIDKNTTKA